MRVAALDLGSNTSLLFIADIENGKIQEVYCDRTKVTKMGQGVHQFRRLHPEALVRLEECFKEYSGLIEKHQAEKVIAVATSAARDVSNGEALTQLAAKYKIPVHIISGEQEARLTFLGALSDQNDLRSKGVIDVGGGSTEVISQIDSNIRGTSVDVGSVRLTELCVTRQPISEFELKKIEEYAAQEFAKAKLHAGHLKEVIAVAGTPTTLAALDQARDFDESFVHGYVLSESKLDDWINRLAKMSIAEREVLPGMQPKRGDVIVTGSIILREAMRALGVKEVCVSTRGVRYGVAMNWREFA